MLSSSCSLHLLRLIWVSGGLLQYGLPHDSFLGLWEQGGDCGHATWRQTLLMEIQCSETNVIKTSAALWRWTNVLRTLNVSFVTHITDWKKVYFWQVKKQLPSQSPSSSLSLNVICYCTLCFYFIEAEICRLIIHVFNCHSKLSAAPGNGYSCQCLQCHAVAAYSWLPAASS